MQARETYPSHQKAAKIDSVVALTSPEPVHIIIALSTAPINCWMGNMKWAYAYVKSGKILAEVLGYRSSNQRYYSYK
jgi:hypothetical protein